MKCDPTFDEVASSSWPVGIECGHCVRRVLVHVKAIRARRGDRRKLSEGALRCIRCGSRDFTASLFSSRSEAFNFTRNH